MGSKLEIECRMPERVRSVEFTENARLPTGLTRQAEAGEGRVIFLEKGCVVVRELVEKGGKRLVKSIALPLNSGLVRTLVLEDEVVGVTSKCGKCGEDFASAPLGPIVCEKCQWEDMESSGPTTPTFSEVLAAQQRAAEKPQQPPLSDSPVHPGGLTGVGPIEALASQQLLLAQSRPPSAEERLGAADQHSATHVPSEQGKLEAAQELAEQGAIKGSDVSDVVFRPVPTNLGPKEAEVVKRPSPFRDPDPDEHVPASAEEALNNRPRRRR